MSGLYCCPLCSVLPPGATHLTVDQSRSLMSQPTLWHGRRSGKFWLVRRVGCKHGPKLDAKESAAAVVEPWNEWAAAEAVKRAKYLKFDADRTAYWLYNMGISDLPELPKK